MEENEKRTKWLNIRLTPKEMEQVTEAWKRTTLTARADFARRLVLGKPVVVTYRNRSLDDIMAEVIRLRKELNNIGNNFNQAVHKLHMVDSVSELKIWLRTYDHQRQIVTQKITEIRQLMDKISDEWLR